MSRTDVGKEHWKIRLKEFDLENKPVDVNLIHLLVATNSQLRYICEMAEEDWVKTTAWETFHKIRNAVNDLAAKMPEYQEALNSAPEHWER